MIDINLFEADKIVVKYRADIVPSIGDQIYLKGKAYKVLERYFILDESCINLYVKTLL